VSVCRARRSQALTSAGFQVKPKSLRLNLVIAKAPRRVLPQGSLAGGVGPSTVKTTWRVTRLAAAVVRAANSVGFALTPASKPRNSAA
jgi:hypothetical protein